VEARRPLLWAKKTGGGGAFAHEQRNAPASQWRTGRMRFVPRTWVVAVMGASVLAPDDDPQSAEHLGGSLGRRVEVCAGSDTAGGELSYDEVHHVPWICGD
jgi:hypothetical protein